VRSKLLFQENQLKTLALVLDKNDDVVPLLLQFAQENNIRSARLSGIGAFQRVRLGYFDRERCEYQPIEINEQVELLSLIGNLARSGGKAKLHAHAIVGQARRQRAWWSPARWNSVAHDGDHGCRNARVSAADDR